MKPPPPYRVLVLCTGNSARSIIGEYLLRHHGSGRFETFSAGAMPTGRINPFAIWVLHEHYGIDANDARSKSWDEFKTMDLDIVITVCDHAKESCPVWPGKPWLAHWSSPDPAAVLGADAEIKQAFVEVAAQIARRVDRLCALPDDQLSTPRLQEIGDEFRIKGEDDMPR